MYLFVIILLFFYLVRLFIKKKLNEDLKYGYGHYTIGVYSKYCTVYQLIIINKSK